MEDQSISEKLEEIKKHAKYITCKKYIQVTVFLYEFNKDYIEVMYHQMGNDLLKIEKVSRAFVEQRYNGELG